MKSMDLVEQSVLRCWGIVLYPETSFFAEKTKFLVHFAWQVQLTWLHWSRRRQQRWSAAGGNGSYPCASFLFSSSRHRCLRDYSSAHRACRRLPWHHPLSNK
jgi:hypothetical protein